VARRLPDDHPLKPVVEQPYAPSGPGEPKGKQGTRKGTSASAKKGGTSNRRASGRKPAAGRGKPAGKTAASEKSAAPARPLTAGEARAVRTVRGLALIAAVAAVPALTHAPSPLVFVLALLLPGVLAGGAALLARRPHGAEAASGHALRVAFPLVAVLWVVSGTDGALAFPERAAPLRVAWWAAGLTGVMLLAGWAAYQADAARRAPHPALTPLAFVSATVVGAVVWHYARVQPSWLHLAVAAGSAALLAVLARPFSRGASLGAGLAAMAFLLLDARKWL